MPGEHAGPGARRRLLRHARGDRAWRPSGARTAVRVTSSASRPSRRACRACGSGAPSISLPQALAGRPGVPATAARAAAVRAELEAVYACAMPAGSTLDLVLEGVPTAPPRRAGLAPEWGQGGACDDACQAVLSDCIRLRTRVRWSGRSPPTPMPASIQVPLLLRHAAGQALTIPLPGRDALELTGSLGLAPSGRPARATRAASVGCRRACSHEPTPGGSRAHLVARPAGVGALDASVDEMIEYPRREGSYYGNVFASQPHRRSTSAGRAPVRPAPSRT